MKFAAAKQGALNLSSQLAETVTACGISMWPFTFLEIRAPAGSCPPRRKNRTRRKSSPPGGAAPEGSRRVSEGRRLTPPGTRGQRKDESEGVSDCVGPLTSRHHSTPARFRIGAVKTDFLAVVNPPLRKGAWQRGRERHARKQRNERMNHSPIELQPQESGSAEHHRRSVSSFFNPSLPLNRSLPGPARFRRGAVKSKFLAGRCRVSPYGNLIFLILGLLLTPAFAEESKKAQELPITSSETAIGIDPKLLCQQWLRSNEEEPPGDEIQVFRPKTFQKFPPSRFRKQYDFEKDGSLKWLDLASNDAHQLKDGKWKVSAKNSDIIQLIKGDVIESYRVTELTRDVLKLRLMTP